MAQASIIRAGKAFIEIIADSTEFDKALTGIQKRLNTFAANAGKVGLAFSGLGAAILAPFTLATRNFASFGDQIDKMSARTGVAAEDLQEIGYAAEQSGASMEAVNTAAKKLYQAMESAARGSKDSVEAFRALGLEADNLTGKSLSEQFAMVADGLAGMATDEEKAAAAMKIFGKAGYDLIPVLKSGREEMGRMQQRARDLGLVMSQDNATAAAKLSTAIGDVRYAVRGLGQSIAVALAPMATSFADATASVVAFVSQIAKANPALTKFAAGIGGIMAAIGSVSLGLVGAAKVVGIVTAALKVLSPVAAAGATALAGITAPIAGIAAAGIAAAAGVGYLISVLKEMNDLEVQAKTITTPVPENVAADPDRVTELNGDIYRQLRSGQTAGEIQSGLQKRADDIKIEIGKIDVDNGAIKDALEKAEKDLADLEIGIGFGVDYGEYEAKKREVAALQASLRSQPIDMEAVEKMQRLRIELASVDRAIKDFANNARSAEQIEQFNKALEETAKRLKAVDDARAQRNQDAMFQNQIDTNPQAATAVISGEFDKAFSDELRIRQRQARIEKEMITAHRDRADALQKEYDELSAQLDVAAKLTDRMDEWRQRGVAAVEDVKKRAKELGESFNSLNADNRTRAQEQAFRDLLDSGNWREANESVMSEMLALENKWAVNTAEIAAKLQEAMTGNQDAANDLERLLNEQRELSDRRITLEGRQREVGGARESADSERLNVLRQMDPERFAREVDDLIRGFGRELEQAFSKISTLEAQGVDASPEYKLANELISKLQEIEGFTADDRQRAGALLGGTYSGEAAQRMGGGSEVARQQLDEQKKTNKRLDDIYRRLGTSGGLGL